MALLFVNLVASFFAHYQAGWKMPGLMLIHLGLLLLLLGGFFTQVTGIEAQVQLLPGEGTNVAESTSKWELSMVKELTQVREVRAVDLDDIRRGRWFSLDDSGLRFRALEVHGNARPMVLESGQSETGDRFPANASGIQYLQPLRPAVEVPQNRPGLLVEVRGAKEMSQALFWGGEGRFLPVELPDGGVRFLALRRKRHPLPMLVELVEFSRAYYPGSQIPKDYRSVINVHTDVEDEGRVAVIRMNEPFREKGWTFYQQSFVVLDDESELTVLAVTRKVGRLIPYVATGVTSLGLALHFLQMQLLQSRRRRKSA